MNVYNIQYGFNFNCLPFTAIVGVLFTATLIV